MNYQTVAKILENVTKREDLIKIITKLVNLDKNVEVFFCDFILKSDDAIKINRIENEVDEYIKDFKATTRICVKKAFLDSKNYRKLEKILTNLMNIFKSNKFSSVFIKNTLKKMSKEYFLGHTDFDEQIYEIIDIMCDSDNDKMFLADCLAERKDLNGLESAALLYKKYNNDEKFVGVMTKLLSQYSMEDHFKIMYDYYKEKSDVENEFLLLESAVRKDVNTREYLPLLLHFYEERSCEDKIEDLEDFLLDNSKWYIDIYYKFMTFHVNEYSLKKMYLMKWIATASRLSIDECYDACKSILTKEDFNYELSNIIERYKNVRYDDFYPFLAKVGKYDEIIPYISKNMFASSSVMRDKCRAMLNIILDKGCEEAASIFCTLLVYFSRKKDTSLLGRALKIFDYMFNANGQLEYWKKRLAIFEVEHDIHLSSK